MIISGGIDLSNNSSSTSLIDTFLHFKSFPLTSSSQNSTFPTFKLVNMFITLRFRVIPQSKQDYQELSKLMRLYGSAYRFAYNRFLEGKSKNEVYIYKQNPIKEEIKKIKKGLTLLKSLQSKPEGLPGAYGRNSGNHQNLWQALEVALTTFLPEKQCFSPLKPILVQGKWERVVRRLGPLCFGGAPVLPYWEAG